MSIRNSVKPRNLHVVLRTCDSTSITSSRIVGKKECVLTCLTSLIKTLRGLTVLPWKLIIIDDNSSGDTKQQMASIAPEADIIHMPCHDINYANIKLRSRHSLAKSLSLIYQLPDHDLIYVAEDDYLYYDDSLEKATEAWLYFSDWFVDQDVGIFPQDFHELHAGKDHSFNDVYVHPCITIKGPDRYYRNTWFTQESFMVQVSLMKKYQHWFDELKLIGSDPKFWEGNTISKVWTQPQVKMFMPLKTLAIHVSRQNDLGFYTDDFRDLWEKNQNRP